MSDYNGYPNSHQSLHPESLFSLQGDSYPGSPGLRRAPRYSRASQPSWVSNNMQSPNFRPPSTPRPLMVSSPPPMIRGASDLYPQLPPPSQPDREREYEPEQGFEPEPEWEGEQEGEPEAEFMTVMPPDDEEAGYGYSDLLSPPAPKNKGRARNFVGGFVTGLRRLPKAMIRSHDKKLSKKGPLEPPYAGDSSTQLPRYEPEDPRRTISDPTSVHYVEAVQMPMEQRASAQLSYTEQARVSDPPLESPNDQNPVPHSPHDRHGTEATSSQHDEQGPYSPVHMDPLPTPDYAKMPQTPAVMRRDDSLSAHITRVTRFIQELYNLPWVSSRVTLDYHPTESSRARLVKEKPAGSWYTAPNHQTLDLLASGPGPESIRLRDEPGSPTQMRARSGVPSLNGAVSATRVPLHRTPASGTTGMFTSPGTSSHMGPQTMSYSYYFSPPQPLYVYQSPMTTPLSHQGSDTALNQPQMSQAVPVYMMAGPPPGLMPSPPPPIYPPIHNQHSRASPPPTIHMPEVTELSLSQ
ncbi:hypothetical protein A0H81_14761 [Grifola frondosa]|uniref:Uncharacterized protein n=1 Tax=Grifola frondosa TaxID=5627 RepID=A0A1C7LKP2_GRIFR|nr:hypothetical protein A0H81_14761 [Grifola frondosa]